MNVEDGAVSDRMFFAMPYPGIFRVTMPLPFPGLNHVHSYFAEGPNGGIVLIDTGLGAGDSWQRMKQGIRWLGRDFSDIERIYLTHAHPDHIGMSKALQDRSGAPVVCHPIAHRIFELMQSADGFQKQMDSLVEHGRESEDVRQNFFALPLPDHFEHIEEGDVVTMAGSEWEVLWTPGHEWGHVAFFRRSDRLLISGDTLLGKITPHVGFHHDPPDPLGQFIDSLDKLAALDASLVIPGHGRSFENGTERAHATKAHHRMRLRRVLEILLHAGPTTAMDVSVGIFGERNFFQQRLALSETLAHLEYLRLRGRIHREQADGRWHYAVPDELVP